MNANDEYKLASLEEAEEFAKKRNYPLDSNRPLYYINESGLRIDALTGNLLKEEDYVKRP